MDSIREKQITVARMLVRMTLKLAGLLLASFLMFPALTGVVMAQGGGKAEPLRIEFKRGTTSTTISDRVWDQVEAEYVFTARKGQRLTIKLTSVPKRSAVFDLKLREADLGWSTTRTTTHVYFGHQITIIVTRPTSSRGSPPASSPSSCMI